MKKNFLKRTACIASSALLCAGAVAMFAGCTTQNPEVTITYTFDGTDYAVAYKLSRYDAPKTVQHFIEIADTGFYDGVCIHDYDGTYFYTGGYTLEGSTLTEKDYFSFVKDKDFTQSVWAKGSDIVSDSPVYVSAAEEMTPLYTVYGEFEANGNKPQNARENSHSYGALVMYYTDKGNDTTRVTTERNDNGKDNDNDKYNRSSMYKYNSATSLFYTFTGTSNSTRDKNYCVFGKVTEDGEEKLKSLIKAIDDYRADLETGESFTESIKLGAGTYMQYEPIISTKSAGLDKEYNTPVDKPIIVKSVKVTKY